MIYDKFYGPYEYFGGMEICYLRGDCRPGDFGEPAIDKNGPDTKHEKQEKMRGLI